MSHHQPDPAPSAPRLSGAPADGEAGALAHLDPATCDRLWMRGRPALQVLAGAFADRDVVSGEVVADEAPFGVQYLLARWL